MSEADTGPVVEFWRGLGPPGLVDVHMHFLPKRLPSKVWEYFDATGPLVGRDWPNLEILEKLRLGDGWLRSLCHNNAAALSGV